MAQGCPNHLWRNHRVLLGVDKSSSSDPMWSSRWLLESHMGSLDGNRLPYQRLISPRNRSGDTARVVVPRFE